jgi:hypothetical protein
LYDHERFPQLKEQNQRTFCIYVNGLNKIYTISHHFSSKATGLDQEGNIFIS